ncbi:MAG: GTPase Era, partial [Oscillospiraceae bacterium]|nr:GTPase Era [Oscillospiraceae bacterium]
MSSRKNVFCAIIGIPNVGKSTLMNRLVGARIAITTPKPQTTRNRIMGVITIEDTQYMFSDTPGMHLPRTRLGEYMQDEIYQAVDGIDLVLFIVYPKESFDEQEMKLLSQLKSRNLPVVLVMNKADILKSRTKGRDMLQKLSEVYDFCDTALVSAADGYGIDELMKTISSYAKPGEFMYDEDTLTDIPLRVIVSEFIREQLIMSLSDELPYGTAVSIESFSERENSDIIDIGAVILCEKESHKGIIIGKGGKKLKQ